MLFFHPLLQFGVILLALFVLWLGWHRFQSLHLHRRGVVFRRQRHVLLGRLTLLLMLAGLFGGLSMAWLTWSSVFITGWHARVAMVIAVLAVIGYATGSHMERVKKRRTWLPLLHGITNAVLVLLALFQIYTGWRVLSMYGII